MASAGKIQTFPGSSHTPIDVQILVTKVPCRVFTFWNRYPFSLLLWTLHTHVSAPGVPHRDTRARQAPSDPSEMGETSTTCADTQAESCSHLIQSHIREGGSDVIALAVLLRDGIRCLIAIQCEQLLKWHFTALSKRRTKLHQEENDHKSTTPAAGTRTGRGSQGSSAPLRALSSLRWHCRDPLYPVPLRGMEKPGTFTPKQYSLGHC